LSATDDQARRLAKNEDMFRRSNEQLAKEARFSTNVFDCICECSRAGCIERLEITSDEYEQVRAKGNRFAVSHGHQNASIEVVVETFPNYLVVEKVGEAGKVARETDPR
jgi:hypothetical protein